MTGNKYDEFFNFRLATIDDVSAIMDFIKYEWRENHILANNKNFFLWQFGNEQYGDEKTINIVLMLDKTGEIAGINGFVAYSSDFEERYVSSMMLKVKSNIDIPLCGVELIKRFHLLVPACAYYSSGINPHTILPIRKKVFHRSTGIMQQFYMLNDRIENYTIPQIKNKNICTYMTTNYRLYPIRNSEEIIRMYDFSQRYPYQAYKSEEYIVKRFFKHPIYQYIVWGVSLEEEKCIGLLIGREIELNGARILRLVDYIGSVDIIGNLGSALHTLMYQRGYEYVDMLVGVLPKELMEKAGFVLRKEDDENIIPTYFEPFVKKNINIYYQKSNPDIVIFKADGDQDRPSIW